MAAISLPPLRDLPQAGVESWLFDFLSQVKESIEILGGARGGAHAVINQAVGVVATDYITVKQLSATGAAFTFQGATVPDADDYHKLLTDLYELVNNINSLQSQVNLLIQQLQA
jgi:hypothetical protein